MAAETSVTQGPVVPPPIDPDVSRLDERTSKAKFIGIMVALTLAMECGPMAATVFYPAAPEIAAHFRTTQVAWGASIVTLAAACLTPLVAKFGDLFGKKRVAILVMIAALLGSVLCAVTGSFALFIVGRGLEGLSITAATISYGLIRDVIPRKYVSVALGALGTGLGAGLIAAPFIAGTFVDGSGTTGYKGLFWFLAGFSVVVIPLLAFLVPESSVRIRRRFDLGGVALLGAAAGLILVALSNGQGWGWESATTLIFLLVGVAAAVAFVLVESRISEPMFSVRMLRSPAVAMTFAVAFLGLLPTMALTYVMPQVAETPAIPGLHYGFGASATHYAVITVGFGILGTIFGPAGGHLAGRFGPRMPLIVAMTLAIVASGGLVLWHTQVWQMALFAAIFGVGYGCNFASTPNLVVEAVPVDEQGAGASLLAFAQNLSAGIVPVLITLIYARNVFLTDPKTGVSVPSNAGIDWAFAIGLIGSAAGLVLALVMRHGRQAASGGARPDAAVLGHLSRNG
jgi:MFS family permease